MEKIRASRNRTLCLTELDKTRLRRSILSESTKLDLTKVHGHILLGDYVEHIANLPDESVDLLILDPPYNLNKKFDQLKFNKQSVQAYTTWLEEVIHKCFPLLKRTASIYICGDWYTSASIFQAASQHFIVRNRITWEREKGRGAKRNWKNTSEDIWFCTVSNDYTFNVDQVKLRRKVIAPYTKPNGQPKDWNQTKFGKFRDTHPSNLWSDITIPFWSMPENTDHPTQKSEKLVAKLILASSQPGDLVLDPFLGSGTTSVVAQKLGRQHLGIEINLEYCLLAAYRLERAITDTEIQGFTDGVFWERNTIKKIN